MQQSKVLSRFLYPSRWITANLIVFLPGTLFTIWINSLQQPTGNLWVSLSIVFVLSAALFVQFLMTPRLHELIVCSFRTAHPGQDIVLLYGGSWWVLLMTIIYIVIYSFVPAVRPIFALIWAVLAALDLIAVLIMSGLGIYWHKHPADYQVLDFMNNAVVNGKPAEINIDLAKAAGDGFVPVGIVCQIDAESGEAAAGVIAINPETGEQKVIFDEGTTIIEIDS